MKMMNKMSKREYLRELKKRYHKASKKRKTQLLNDFCTFTGYHRKSALRLINGRLPNQWKRTRPRSRKYDLETIKALRFLWQAAGEICAERFHPFIPTLLKCLTDQGEISISNETKKKLLEISQITVKRIIAHTKHHSFVKIGGLTKPGSLIKSQITLRYGKWEEKEPGWFETDTVGHSGGNLKGEFIYSLNITDISSHWSEQAAIWGKSEKATTEQVDRIRKRLPFEMRGLDPDNGGEFINWSLYHYCQRHAINFTRAREYHPNDQAHIEQKNYTAIRKLLGYGRLDKKSQQALMNDLYNNEWRLYLNFFQPTLKLKKKIKNLATGKCSKTYYRAQTPYQRLMKSKYIFQDQKLLLKSTYKQLNPLKLRREIERKIELIRRTLK